MALVVPDRRCAALPPALQSARSPPGRYAAALFAVLVGTQCVAPPMVRDWTLDGDVPAQRGTDAVFSSLLAAAWSLIVDDPDNQRCSTTFSAGDAIAWNLDRLRSRN